MPFKLQVRYSVAGKVSLENGEPLRHVELALLDERGRQMRSFRTDEFGLYRADSLPPGRYRIVLVHEGELLAAREVIVRDTFLFEQDLLLEDAGALAGV